MPVAANSRTSQDLSQLLLEHWRTKSDRQIALLAGVSNRTVSSLRQRLEDDGEIVPRRRATQSGEACLYTVCSSAIRPAALNDRLYDPVDESEPAFITLVDSIREHGILEPIVVSADGYILSGHRRYAAVCQLGIQRLTIRIRHDISLDRNPDEFLRLLATFNRQRTKTSTEQLREEVALMSSDSVQVVQEYRQSAVGQNTDQRIELRSRKRRSAVRDKLEMRDAIIRIVKAESAHWPLSDRAIHYRLLNISGLVRNDKTRVPYANTPEAYNDATNMLTRLRLDGSIPFDAIADETRPVSIWDTHRCVGDFVRNECEQFLSRYHRSLQQSQPRWIELLVEKNTVATQLRSIAAKYTVPLTSGRGYSSLPPRKEMVDRFRRSGRDQLVVIVVSDFDPEGEDIPSSFGVSLRDDFRVDPEQLQIVKAALTAEQVRTMNLHEGQLSKEASSRYQRFQKAHGDRVWELESLTTLQLQQIVEDSLRSVLDLRAFELELERQQLEQLELNSRREQLRTVLTTDLNVAS